MLNKNSSKKKIFCSNNYIGENEKTKTISTNNVYQKYVYNRCNFTLIKDI